MNFALPFGPRLTAKLMRTKHFGDDQTHSMGGGGAVVVARLVEWSLPTPEVSRFESSHWKAFYINYILSTVLKR